MTVRVFTTQRGYIAIQMAQGLCWGMPVCLRGKKVPILAPGTQACNPSYSGGRDQKNQDSKSAQASSS
jgi:hypothetical protein